MSEKYCTTPKVSPENPQKFSEETPKILPNSSLELELPLSHVLFIVKILEHSDLLDGMGLSLSSQDYDTARLLSQTLRFYVRQVRCPLHLSPAERRDYLHDLALLESQSMERA